MAVGAAGYPASGLMLAGQFAIPPGKVTNLEYVQYL